MATSNDGTTTTNYLINFMGQGTKKSNSTDTTWFIYDEHDNVIAEYDAAGNLTNEYVYLDNRPVALLRSSNLYYIYTDHLNTPRAITDTANNLQWTWENKEAFGNNLPTEVVTGFKFNFRFPGQYFDSETNLNYNIHRDYNPVWGRYMSSDPLGLAAGINTYGYVSGNSLRNSDPTGLCINNGTTVTCSPSNGFPSISFPAPKGWPKSFNVGNKDYHYYNTKVDISCATEQDTLLALINYPTPGNPNAATVTGTYNNASPLKTFQIPTSPVISYIVNNNIIVNVTQPSHPLFPGYVARAITKNKNGVTVNNYGEGTGLLQSEISPVSHLLRNIWIGQVKDISTTIPNNCSCGR